MQANCLSCLEQNLSFLIYNLSALLTLSAYKKQTFNYNLYFNAKSTGVNAQPRHSSVPPFSKLEIPGYPESLNLPFRPSYSDGACLESGAGIAYFKCLEFQYCIASVHRKAYRANKSNIGKQQEMFVMYEMMNWICTPIRRYDSLHQSEDRFMNHQVCNQVQEKTP